MYTHLVRFGAQLDRLVVRARLQRLPWGHGQVGGLHPATKPMGKSGHFEILASES